MIRTAWVTIAVALMSLPVPGVAEENRGIEIRGVDEQPGVLHLVPWRLPEDDLPEAPRVEKARFDRLMEPVDDRAHRRHMHFRKNPEALLEAFSTDKDT